MDFIDKLKELSARIPNLKSRGLVTTEEGAKNALVMPFIQTLGYDVFNPLEVTPELTADVGTKKGEKVDYAIFYEEKPVILIECKGFGVDLSQVHASQLYRYFSVSEARFGILTNGIQYMFYSDLESPNRMDEKPFFLFDLSNFKKNEVEALKQFSKSAFDQDKIINTASELKYKGAIKKYLAQQLSEPSEDFVRLCLKDIYSGRFTQSVLEELTPITKDALRAFINDQVEKRLKSALASDSINGTPKEKTVEKEEAIEEREIISESDSKIDTTQEEIDAYLTIKAIVREIIDVKRIDMRDAQSYCTILVDDNNRQTLCRLRFNSSTTKYVGILDEEKNETKYPVDTADDIYQYADLLKERAGHFVEK